ncbi:CopG family ribbon-helix-helix protein [Pararhizobium sp.]|uniref:CopG family ribbon-helix-helix protein n=1 Tax=Pararhizobium sp. TaxID=1977563 RepID=UPI0027225CED|nr:CopG family ribbon-helix-helix protein [Pararhizobium sp.]MDO9414832.1 CopG family ribbon-helix-helix protein [Pararhizobium sp.]
MPPSTTVTIRMSVDANAKLAKLASDTRRSKSFLAAEAVSAYVDRELEIIEGIHRGLADVEAGRLVPHSDVIAEARQIVAAAKISAK